jgi:hypothetical protein
MLSEETCLPFSDWVGQIGGVTEQEQQTLIAHFDAIYQDVLAELLTTAQGIAPGDLTGGAAIQVTRAQAAAMLAFFDDAPRGTPGAVAGQSAAGGGAAAAAHAAGGPPVVQYQGAVGGPDSGVAGGSDSGAPGHRFTVGIPAAGLYDYLHAGTGQPAAAGLPEQVGFIFGTQVAAQFSYDMWAPPRGTTRLSWVTTEFLDQPDVTALRGVLALAFSHTIASAYPGQVAVAGWRRPDTAVAPRYTPDVLRRALSPAAQDFLTDQAPWIKDQFAAYADWVVPGFSQLQPAGTVGDGSTAGNYLDGLLQNEPGGKWRAVLDPSAVQLELNTYGEAEPAETQAQLQHAAEQAYEGTQGRAPGPAGLQQQSLQQLAADSRAVQLDWLLDTAAVLSVVGEKMFGEGFAFVADNAAPGVVAALWQHIHPDLPYPGTSAPDQDTSAAQAAQAAQAALQGLIGDLTGLAANLQIGAEFGLEDGIWGRYGKTLTQALEQADILLNTLMPDGGADIAPPQDALTGWHDSLPETNRPPSPALQNIGSAVDAILEQPDDVRSLRQALVEIAAARRQQSGPDFPADVVAQLERKIVADLAGLTEDLPGAEGAESNSAHLPPPDGWAARVAGAAGTAGTGAGPVAGTGQKSTAADQADQADMADAAGSATPAPAPVEPSPIDRLTDFNPEQLLQLAISQEITLAEQELAAAKQRLEAAKARRAAGEQTGCEVEVEDAMVALAKSRAENAQAGSLG